MSTLIDITTLSPLDRARLAAILREDMRDKGYQLLPIGQDAASYLRHKRKRLTAGSLKEYESVLDKLARHFAHLELEDLEPPVGTARVEEFLEHQWGNAAPGTYNRNLSIVKDFFRWAILRERLHGDPTLAIERARKRDIHRETFAPNDLRAILAENADLRDRVALRLLLDYGLRKGALTAVQYKHFDHVRKRLTIFTKGGKIRQVPIPDPRFWHDLGRLILDVEAKPSHYLMCSRRTVPNGRRRPHVEMVVRYFPEKPLSGHGMHSWWYRCLAGAGLVSVGVEKGERMHKARHTAGQRVLDHTGNLKAVQKLLGHASINTTGDVYADWDLDQLAQTMADVLGMEDDD